MYCRSYLAGQGSGGIMPIKKYYQRNREHYLEYNKNYLKEHPVDKEKKKANNKRYYEKNKEDILKKNKIYCKENIEIARKSWLQTSKRYAKNHPERVKAHTIARKIPMKFACEICGSKEKLQRHHLRYDKPLLFLTLCDYCHKVQHKQILNEVKKFQ